MRVQGKGNTWADDPEDRALSYVYQEVETSASPEVRTSSEETWRSKTATGIADLLTLHGPCPAKL